jgi:hypothetical protein
MDDMDRFAAFRFAVIAKRATSLTKLEESLWKWK